VGVETTKVSTVSWADIAESANRIPIPKSDGGLKEKEADQHSSQTGHGDEHRA